MQEVVGNLWDDSARGMLVLFVERFRMISAPESGC